MAYVEEQQGQTFTLPSSLNAGDLPVNKSQLTTAHYLTLLALTSRLATGIITTSSHRRHHQVQQQMWLHLQQCSELVALCEL